MKKRTKNLRFRFKAKHANGYWIHGAFMEDDSGNFGFQWTRFNIPQGVFADIVPETFCQSTGIRDSDKNLIYEHDFIRIESYKGETICPKVEICCNSWIWTQKVYAKDGITIEPSVLGLDELYAKGKIKIFVIGNRFDEEESE